MNQREVEALSWAVFLMCSVAIAIGLAILANGCGPHVDPRAAAFGVELQECVRASDTRAEADACREGVEARYGHPSSTRRDSGK